MQSVIQSFAEIAQEKRNTGEYGFASLIDSNITNMQCIEQQFFEQQQAYEWYRHKMRLAKVEMEAHRREFEMVTSNANATVFMFKNHSNIFASNM